MALNIWQKKVWQMNRIAKGLFIKLLIWMVLVWQITDISPNSQNFLPAKLSCYTVYGAPTIHRQYATLSSSVRRFICLVMPSLSLVYNAIAIPPSNIHSTADEFL